MRADRQAVLHRIRANVTVIAVGVLGVAVSALAVVGLAVIA